MGGQPVEGQYEATNGIPVGTIAFITVSDPVPGYTITEIAWSGGTTYSGYFSAAPNNAVFGGQELEQNVATTTSDYIFIVDSTARQYNISVSVVYSNSARGTSTLTFTSVRPTATLAVSQVGIQEASATIRPGNITVRLDPPIKIQATSTTDADTSGNFMFMQVINSSYRRYIVLLYPLCPQLILELWHDLTRSVVIEPRLFVPP